jgi:hypothetical protein
MPVDFELDASTKIVRARGAGTLSDADLLAQRRRMESLIGSGRVDGEWAVIADFSGVTSMDGVTSQAVRRLAQESPWPAHAIRVVVVGSDEAYGLARMYQAIGDRRTEGMAVVRTPDEAEAYIAEERARRRAGRDAGTAP